MPVKKLKSGRWKAGSYTTHTKSGGTKWFKGTFKTKAAAERRAATSKRRSKRKRSTKRKGRY